MVLLSKPLTDEQKQFIHARICELAVLGVATQNIQSLADTQLMSDCLNGDAGRVGANLALASSIGGVIEFLTNPIVGKLSDDWGRKFIFYSGPLLSGVGMSALVLLTGGNSVNILLAHKALSWALMSQSCSFIAPITFSDMFAGKELGIKTVQFFGSIGLSIMLFPLAATFFQRRGGRLVLFKVRLVTALIQLLYVYKFVPETLTEERRVAFKASDINPLSFLRLFSGTRTLRLLALSLFFSCCVEGKNLSALRAIWTSGPPMHLPIEKQSLALSIFGGAAIASGKYLAPRLMQELGNRAFTSTATLLNALSFIVTASPIPSYQASYALGLALHLPGANNTNSAPLRAMATDHAIASGFARGEYGGMYSSIRTLSMIIAPMILGWAYKKGVKGKSAKTSAMGLALPWLIAAILGGIVPELIHRSLTDEDLVVPKSKD